MIFWPWGELKKSINFEASFWASVAPSGWQSP